MKTYKYVTVPAHELYQKIRMRPHCVHGHTWTKKTRYICKFTGAICCRRCKAESQARARAAIKRRVIQ